MKDILIIANFCRDFSKTDNGRFMYLCKELSAYNNVEIVTSDFSHALKSFKQPLVHDWPFKITFLHESGYSKNISIKRFYSHRTWGKSVNKYLKQRKKPDVIYCAIPSLTAPHEVARYCKNNNVRFIIDIQDLWPEAFQMVFNIPLISGLIFYPFKHLANYTYKQANSICAVSKTFADRALTVNNYCKDVNVVYLGTNIDLFRKYALENKVTKPNDEFWIGYCGTLGASYDITIAIDAISYVNKVIQNKKIRFIVLGNGERLDEFKQHAINRNVDCIFTGRLPYEKMCGWLSSCDLAVNPIRHKAAQSIINKHGDYVAAGLPVLSTQENQEYRDLIDEYHFGFNCDNFDPNDMADKMIKLINDNYLRTSMSNNAKKCAEEKFDRKYTYNKLINCILD